MQLSHSRVVKIRKLIVSAFGPYAKEQELDFEKYLAAVEIYKEALFDMDRLNYYNTKLEKLFDNLSLV